MVNPFKRAGLSAIRLRINPQAKDVKPAQAGWGGATVFKRPPFAVRLSCFSALLLSCLLAACHVPLTPPPTVAPAVVITTTPIVMDTHSAFQMGITYVLDRIVLTPQTSQNEIEATFGQPCYSDDNQPDDLGDIWRWYRIPIPDRQGNPDSCSLRISYERRQLTVKDLEVETYQFSQATADNLVETFGPPETVLGPPCEGFVDSCAWLLGYPSMGFEVYLTEQYDNPDDDSAYYDRKHIASGQPFNSVYLYPPMSLDEYHKHRADFSVTIYNWNDVWLGQDN